MYIWVTEHTKPYGLNHHFDLMWVMSESFAAAPTDRQPQRAAPHLAKVAEERTARAEKMCEDSGCSGREHLPSSIVMVNGIDRSIYLSLGKDDH